MLKKILLLAAAGLLCSGYPAAAQELGIGDPAPKLEVKEFVKGQPLKELAKGKVHVVEFWATWCGPCRATIPHLTELQKKYPDVPFIGVSVWEQDQKAVLPFVKEMGAKMDYRVAVDKVPDGAEGDKGVMASTWMQAAGQGGIPTAFIVNKEGKIAWIGHPTAMDRPLAQVVAGTWDLEKAAAESKQERLIQQKLEGLREKLAGTMNDPKKMLAVIDEALAADASVEKAVGMFKFRLLSGPAGQPEHAATYGAHLVEKVYAEEPQALNQLSWTLVAPDAPKPSPGMAALALKAARQADKITEEKDPQIADTLARAYFVTGDAARALTAQERAVRLAKGTPLEANPELKQRLEEYRKAAKK